MSETVTQVNETTQQIVRSRTCGLKDFYIALVQSNTATAYTAGTPVKLARAIKAKIDEKWTSEKIYSDDNTEEVITSYEGTDVELEINALAPQDRVILFGQLYEKGFLRKSSDDRAPEVAVGWRERKLNGKYEFKWLYVGKFAEGISEEASTKEGKLSPTTKSIKGSFYERSIDNLYEVLSGLTVTVLFRGKDRDEVQKHVSDFNAEWERSERSSRVMIELSLLLSGISVAFAIFFGISNKKRNDKKDAEQETEERATANTLMMTKLENIANDVKDIKRDYKETRAEVQDLHDRVLIVEQSLKSYHKRLDGMNLNIKTDQ